MTSQLDDLRKSLSLSEPQSSQLENGNNGRRRDPQSLTFTYSESQFAKTIVWKGESDFESGPRKCYRGKIIVKK